LQNRRDVIRIARFSEHHGAVMSKTRIGATLWVLCLQYFIAEAVVISGWPGAYSLSRNYISDLGAVHCGVRLGAAVDAAESVCSPLHGLMNASFLLQGALILSGTALLWSRFPKGAWWTAALVLVGASGIGVFVVGLAPEDAAPRLHFLGAIENFLCCNAGMAAMGVAMSAAPRPARKLGLVTLAMGAVGLLGIAMLGLRVYLGLGVGGMERLVAYPFPLWLAGMGVLLLKDGGSIVRPANAR
jgi:hypothetical membrane protein